MSHNKAKKSVRQLFNAVLIAVSLIVAAVFIAVAYSGTVSPMESKIMPIAGLGFPLALFVVTILLLTALCIRQWIPAAIFFLSLLISAGPILTFFPMSISRGGIDKNNTDVSFSLLTFNVMNFTDYSGEKHEPNRTIKYILDTDADIVCLQEAAQFDEYNIDDYIIISKISDIKKKYPYCYNEPGDVVILSKFPFKHTGETIKVDRRNKFEAFDVDVKGHKIKIFNCHLESIGLTETDKDLYRELTQLHKMRNMEDIEEVKETLLSKLAKAFRNRAIQAQAIRECIDNSEQNIIVCGDFNDTPGSYSYRKVLGNDMSDAYRDCAFWPTITYHSNRFFFRIDQMLYRGDFKAVSIRSDKIDSSDHYPLLATFVFKPSL